MFQKNSIILAIVFFTTTSYTSQSEYEPLTDLSYAEQSGILRKCHFLRMQPKRKDPNTSKDEYQEARKKRKKRKKSTFKRSKKQRKYRTGRKEKFKKRFKKKKK